MATPGTWVSGVGHVGLIAWLLMGWGLSHEPLDFQVSELSVVSSEEYAALVAAARPAAPEAIVEPVAAPAPPPTETALPAPAEEAPVEVAQPEPPPEAPVEEAPPPAPPEPPAPPAEVADVSPDVTPPTPEAGAPDLPPSSTPTPRPVPRVAPEAAPPPPPDAAIAPEVAETAQPAPTPEPVPVEEETTAPEEAAPETVTEADDPSFAPEVALRPPSRPSRPTPPAVPETPPEETVASSQNVDADAVADALAAAVAAADPEPVQGGGVPLTGTELDAFRVSVQRCWVVDPGSQAARVRITVAFELTREGRVAGSVERLRAEGGDGAAAESAFQAARRAVLRCQGDGFPLPADKYDQWRLVEMTFDGSAMVIR